MSLKSCRLALEQIRMFQYRPFDKSIVSLVNSAAEFVKEIASIGLDVELRRRKDLFDSLTRSGSEFDNARAAAHEHLKCNVASLYLPDPHRGTWGPSYPKFIETPSGLEVRYLRDVPNRVRKIVKELGEAIQTPLQLQQLLDDVEAILSVATTGVARGPLKVWRQRLLDVSSVCAKERLIGTHLLAACHAAKSKYAIASELGNAANVIELKDAAASLYLIASESETTFTSYYHGRDAIPPIGFQHGPLKGKLKELAAACFPNRTLGDTRPLKQYAKAGMVWLKRYSGQAFEIWFPDLQAKAQANAELLELRASGKQQKVARKNQD